MRVIADTHVHLYDRYDMGTALRTLADNLDRLDSEAVQFGFLTERRECNFFEAIRNTGPKSLAGQFDVESLAGDGVLTLLKGGTPELVLVAGRQMATAERVEVLALATTAQFEDGQPTADTIRRVLDAGAVPVLSWAAGKWLGGRGRAVKATLQACEPGNVLLGDSSLRPVGWPEPDLFKYALQNGFGVLAGSDVLPVSGEERYLGKYASSMEMEFDPSRPLASIRAAFRSAGAGIRRTGRRCGLAEVMTRLCRYQAGRHAAARGPS